MTGIPVELFQILKDDAVKVLHWIYQQIWKTQQDWKGQFSFQFQRKGNRDQKINEVPRSHGSVDLQDQLPRLGDELGPPWKECVGHEGEGRAVPWGSAGHLVGSWQQGGAHRLRTTAPPPHSKSHIQVLAGFPLLVSPLWGRAEVTEEKESRKKMQR